MIVVPSPIVSLKLFRVIENVYSIYIYIYTHACVPLSSCVAMSFFRKACKAYLESLKVLCFSKVFSAHSGQFVGKGATCFGLRAQVSQLSQQTMQPKKERIDKTSENKH